MFEARCQGDYRVSLQFGFGDGLGGEMLLVERLGLSPSWARAVGHCPLLPASFWCVPGCSRVFPLFFVPASCSCPLVPFTSVPPELQDPLNYFI